MAIYKVVGDKEKLTEIAATSFSEEKILEREDLQRMLCAQPGVLEEGLLIISEEFGDWEDSNRRIDLLGLDADGCLVVIELKRGDTGAHMDLQAIRYAAMVANMTFQQVVDTFQAHLEKIAGEENGQIAEHAAEEQLRDHLASKDPDDLVVRTEVPRIILASENFGKELTTCVMWLNDSWLRNAGNQIKCLRLQPHRDDDGTVLIEASVMIPLPEASDYQTQIGKRGQEIGPITSRKAQTVRGAAAFQKSIARAPERFQPGLERLYIAAIAMEQEKIAELATNISGKADYVRLELRLPGTDTFLISFNNLLWDGKERGGEISFWPTEDVIAPNALSKIDLLIGEPKSKSGVRHRRLSGKQYDWQAIMAAIEEAYREASDGASSSSYG